MSQRGKDDERIQDLIKQHQAKNASRYGNSIFDDILNFILASPLETFIFFCIAVMLLIAGSLAVTLMFQPHGAIQYNDVFYTSGGCRAVFTKVGDTAVLFVLEDDKTRYFVESPTPPFDPKAVPLPEGLK